jgi:pilus assembly protein Flp/PilA
MNNATLWLAVRLDSLKHRDRGATAVEYGLIVALIAVAIITAVTLLGTNLSAMFNSIAGKVQEKTP